MKQTFFDIISDLFINLKTYINSKIDLYLLTAFEKVARLHSTILSAIIMVLISFFCLFFITLAFAVWIGEKLQNYPLGFIIIGGGYMLLGIIFLIFRKKLVDNIVLKSLMKALFPKEKN